MFFICAPCRIQNCNKSYQYARVCRLALFIWSTLYVQIGFLLQHLIYSVGMQGSILRTTVNNCTLNVDLCVSTAGTHRSQTKQYSMRMSPELNYTEPYLSSTHPVYVRGLLQKFVTSLGNFGHNFFKTVAHTPLHSVRFRSWSRFLAVSLQVTWVIKPAVGCHYFQPGPQFPSQPLRGLLPILLLGEHRHNGWEQFA